MANDRTRTLRVPLLMNGVSRQPPIERLPNQVATATNANFSVVDGFTRRPGSWIQQYVHPGLLPAANNRLHEIIRDQNERYVIVHNRTSSGAILRILELATNLWADITISTVAQNYLNSGSPDEFRMRTLLDTTLVINTAVRTSGFDKSGVIEQVATGNPAVIKSTAHGFAAGNGTTTAIVSNTTTEHARITSAAHGLTSGLRVTIAGSNSTPPVDGTWNVTVLDANTFTIPITTTGSGNAGLWTRGQTITIDGSNTTPSLDRASYPVTVIDADHFSVPVNVTQTASANITLIISTTPPEPINQADVSSVNHGLVSGQIVTITGSNSAPSIDGTWVVVTLGANVFRIATPVVTPGNTGTWTLGVGATGKWYYAAVDNRNMPMQLVRQNTSTNGTITGISVANPTVALSVAHGLVTGQTVHITGSNSTPSIDGAYQVNVLSVNLFSIPVNVTVLGNAGTWVAAAYFTLDSIIWNSRESGNTLTNPLPKIWTRGDPIFDLRYWRSRLAVLSQQGGILTQAEDLFNLFIADVNAIGDADPIPFSISSDENVVVDYGVPLQEDLMIFAKAGKQFLLNSSGLALSPSTLRCDPITTYRTLPAEPLVMDPAVYFGVNVGGNIHLFEYYYDEVSAPNTAEDVTLHVTDYIPLLVNVPGIYGAFPAAPSTLRRIAVSHEEGFVFVLRRDQIVNGEVFGTTIHVYRTRYVGTKKAQVAWMLWTLAGIRGIHDLVVVGTYLYVLVHCGTKSPPDFYILRINIPIETAQDAPPFPTT